MQKTNDFTTFGVVTTNEEASAMRAEAAKLGLSRSGFVRKLFQEYLEQQHEINDYIKAMTEERN